MSDYVPPSGDQVDLDLAGPGYEPDPGDGIELEIAGENDLGAYRKQSLLLMFLG